VNRSAKQTLYLHCGRIAAAFRCGLPIQIAKKYKSPLFLVGDIL
jgi:hypothetical protein